jgi:hypothetical protein
MKPFWSKRRTDVSSGSNRIGTVDERRETVRGCWCTGAVFVSLVAVGCGPGAAGSAGPACVSSFGSPASTDDDEPNQLSPASLRPGIPSARVVAGVVSTARNVKHSRRCNMIDRPQITPFSCAPGHGLFTAAALRRRGRPQAIIATRPSLRAVVLPMRPRMRRPAR